MTIIVYCKYTGQSFYCSWTEVFEILSRWHRSFTIEASPVSTWADAIVTLG